MSDNFFDDALALFTFGDIDVQLIENIEKERGSSASGGFSYIHNDHTTVTMEQRQGGGKAGRDGLDVIFSRDDGSYMHFQTIAEDNYENAKLNITIRQNDSISNCSYSIDNILSNSAIEETLEDKNKALATIYKTYIPKSYIDMQRELRRYEAKQRKEEKLAAALDKWNEGR